MDKQECIGYVDSDYARDFDKCRSTTEYVFILFKHRWAGALFYSLLSQCRLRRPSIWLWRRLWSRQFGFKGCSMTWGLIRIYWISTMIAWVLSIWQITRRIMQGRSTSTLGSTFIREILDEGDIELHKIHTKENPADILTKIVPWVKFAYCNELLHILLIAWARWSSFG